MPWSFLGIKLEPGGRGANDHIEIYRTTDGTGDAHHRHRHDHGHAYRGRCLFQPVEGVHRLAGAAVTIVLGAILSIMGYEDLWNTGTRRHSSARASSSRKRSAKRPRRK